MDWATTTTAGDQMNKLVDVIQSKTVHRIDCVRCDKSETISGTTEQRFARHLYGTGWRADSETTGAVCPACACK